METTLNVPDISCGHCVQTISRALEPLDGIHTVRVDIGSRTVSLTYDQPAHLRAAFDALAEEGYPVDPGSSAANDENACDP